MPVKTHSYDETPPTYEMTYFMETKSVFFFATVSLAVWMLFLLLIDFLFKSRGDRSVLDTEELRASRLRAVSSTERSAREKRQRPHAW